MSKLNVGVIVGSLRKDSNSLKVAKVLNSLASDNMELNIIDISELVVYNEDFENALPEAYSVYRKAVKEVDGLILVSPEYNRTMSGAMKNAIDVASRPYAENAFSKMPVLVISTSGGALGGFGAHHHMRQALVVLNAYTLGSPEIFIMNSGTLFDEDGNLTDERTKKSLVNGLNKFEEWIKIFK